MCAALRQMQTDLQRSIQQSLAALLPWHISAEQSPKAFVGRKKIQEKNSGPNSYRLTQYYHASVRQKWSRLSTVIKQSHLLFGTSTKILQPIFLHGRTLTVSSHDLLKSNSYLCSTALLRRSFSLFSTAASGLTWEIFSSSVPLMLDARLLEGVSRPDSWWRRQAEQRFSGSLPASLIHASHRFNFSLHD